MHDPVVTDQNIETAQVGVREIQRPLILVHVHEPGHVRIPSRGRIEVAGQVAVEFPLCSTAQATRPVLVLASPTKVHVDVRHASRSQGSLELTHLVNQSWEVSEDLSP